MRRTAFFLALVVLLTGGLSGAAARSEAAAESLPPGPEEELLRCWNRVGHKLTEMAADFPEDKYDYKPTPDVRSFAEQLLHVAGSTYFFMDIARGEKPGEEDLPRESYKRKAQIVAALKKSFADGAAFIREAGPAGLARAARYPWSEETISVHGIWLDAAEHVGEHYGNLVVYYRRNGIVPPASRPQP